MDLQQVFFYEYRLDAAAPLEPEEPRFFAGLLNCIIFSLPLWVLIAWGVRALLS